MLCCAARPAGQPPSRLQGSEDENIQDVMARVDRVAEEKEEQRLANDPQYQDLAQKQVQKVQKVQKRGHGDNGDIAADV